MAQRLTVLRPIGGGVSAMRKLLVEAEKAVMTDAQLTFEKIADEVEKEVRRRAPRDTGALEGAIKQRQGGRGGQSIIVYVDEQAAPYARQMHEGMFDAYPDDGRYFLGDGSLAKNRGNAHEEPFGVGVKFLERGAEYAVQHAGRPAWRRHLSTMTTRILNLGRSLLRRG